LIAFAYATWLYRLILFFAIAALVYSFFIKLIGILLFVVEIVWFVLLPLYNEFKIWRQKWPSIKRQSRTQKSVVISTLCFMLFALPWPSRVVTSGLLKPEKSFTVYAPTGAQLVSLPWNDGVVVDKGELLLTMAAPEITKRWNMANARQQRARLQLESSGVDANQRGNLQVVQQELEVAQAEVAQVNTELLQYQPTAPFKGVLFHAEPDLAPGVWLKQQDKLASLVSIDSWIVETYLDEDEIRLINVGDNGTFMSDGHGLPTMNVKVVEIDKDATRLLSTAMLSAPAGGSVMVRDKQGQLIPDKAYYRVVLASDNQLVSKLDKSWRGKLVIRGKSQIPIMRYIQSATVVLWREAGF
jgi:putative peptide zinc metalloprotease protein